jgi:hypothetical protein
MDSGWKSPATFLSRQGEIMAIQLLAASLQATNSSSSDQDERLEAQVLRRVGGRVRDFRVLVRHNGIVLRGRCATYHAKQVAQHTAMELTGLPILANDIEVS